MLRVQSLLLLMLLVSFSRCWRLTSTAMHFVSACKDYSHGSSVTPTPSRVRQVLGDVHGMNLGDCEAFFPPMRNFARIRQTESEPVTVKRHQQLRLLQFNMLADGLSGLRSDLGDFSRLTAAELDWSKRQWKILFELLQYEPDVITLQECDHFDDVFLPFLRGRGYDGVFMPKTNSPCLQVSDRSDGCAIFWKTSKIRCEQVQRISFHLLQNQQQHREELCAAVRERVQVEKQNQVALMVRCAITDDTASEPVRVLIATTHLKAKKSFDGEKIRVDQMEKLLAAIQQNVNERGDVDVVIVAGDLNTPPSGSVFPSLVYDLIRSHPLRLRSVLNDDLLSTRKAELATFAEDEIWTTWKARNRTNSESVVRHCIDYILYASTRAGSEVKATRVLDGFRDSDVACSLFPNQFYPSDHIAIGADLDIKCIA